MKLIVGLGNPGREYRDTRHNVGFLVVDEIARRHQLTWAMAPSQVPDAFVAKRFGAEPWMLAKPLTFMNNSGRAVGALASFYRIPPEEILIAHDELDLPPGEVRLKFGGGLSGHNGLRDVAPALATQDFWRLRIGIGHPRDMPAGGGEPVDYVLHPPRAEDREAIEDAIEKALAVWPLIAAHDLQAAMLKLHTKPVSGKP